MAPFGISAVILTAAGVIWSYLGVETVTIAAGETENPEKNVPSAIKTVFFRIVLFYVGSVTVMSLVVPFTDVSVMNNGYAGVFKLAGFQAAAVCHDIVILTSLASCTNSVVYVASRMLMALSQEGKAPKLFGRVNSKGIPTPAILMTMAIGLISLATNFASPDKVFVWIVLNRGLQHTPDLVRYPAFHYRFRKWLVNNGGKVENLKFKSKAYPTATVWDYCS